MCLCKVWPANRSTPGKGHSVRVWKSWWTWERIMCLIQILFIHLAFQSVPWTTWCLMSNSWSTWYLWVIMWAIGRFREGVLVWPGVWGDLGTWRVWWGWWWYFWWWWWWCFMMVMIVLSMRVLMQNTFTFSRSAGGTGGERGEAIGEWAASPWAVLFKGWYVGFFISFFYFLVLWHWVANNNNNN